MAKTNPTLGTLIELARDGSAAMPERHQAFEEIVRRFVHLVAACAYASLRDPALAEDAAQDTCLLAWQCLRERNARATACSTDGTAVRLVAPTGADLTAWLASQGFVQVADRLLLERLLRKTVPIAQHGDGLIGKTRDMRDLLLASSESEFFTRHHDGRGRFERDETGRVARLVIREGPREFIANRE
jgi:sigma-70-like protein